MEVTIRLAVCVPVPKSKYPLWVAVTVAGAPPVPSLNVARRKFVGTETFTYEIVPGKFSLALFRHPPIVTGPLPITFASTLNDAL